MNLPTKAEDVHRLLAAAYNTGDLAIVLAIYDVDGIIVSEPANPVSGKEKFEAAVKTIVSVRGTMEIKTVYCLQTGDVAVGRSEWSIKDGGSAKGVEVMKRQPNGTGRW